MSAEATGLSYDTKSQIQQSPRNRRTSRHLVDPGTVSLENLLLVPEITRIDGVEVKGKLRSFNYGNMSDALLTVIGRSTFRQVPPELEPFVVEREEFVGEDYEAGQPPQKVTLRSLFGVDIDTRGIYIATTSLQYLNPHVEMHRILRTPGRLLDREAAMSAIVRARNRQRFIPEPTALFDASDYFRFQDEGLKSYLVLGRLTQAGQENVFGIVPTMQNGDVATISRSITLSRRLEGVIDLRGQVGNMFVYGFVDQPHGLQHAA